MRTRKNLKPEKNHLNIQFPYAATIDAAINGKVSGCMPGVFGEDDLEDSRKEV